MSGWLYRPGRAHGCDCDCGHHTDEHDPECERCLACEISEALTPAAAPTATHQGDTE